MSRAKLMKILFLVDRELYRRCGATVFRWKMYKYGPFSREVLDILDDMEIYGSVASRIKGGAVVYELTSTADVSLPGEVREAADRVLGEWAGRSADELIDYLYSLEEVREAWPGRPLLQ
jgi:hypothetical protein